MSNCAMSFFGLRTRMDKWLLKSQVCISFPFKLMNFIFPPKWRKPPLTIENSRLNVEISPLYWCWCFFANISEVKNSWWLFPKWRFLHLNVFMLKKKINIKKKLKRSVMFADFSNGALIVVFFCGFSKYYGKNVRIRDFRGFFIKVEIPT